MPNRVEGQVLHGIQSIIRDYAECFVYSNDRNRFLSFLDFDNVCRQTSQSQTASDSSVFRIKQADGSYRWTVFLVLLLRDDGRHAVLSRRCMGNGAGPQEPAARTGYVFWHPRIGTGPSALFPPLAGTLPGHDPLFGHQVLLVRKSPPLCRCQSVFSRLLWLEKRKSPHREDRRGFGLEYP